MGRGKNSKAQSIAIAHLQSDEMLKALIRAHGPLRHKKDLDLYLSLLRAIVGQQLSVKAARTIWERFLKLFGDTYPSPELLLSLETEALRSCGLSLQKAGYLKNIAEFALNSTLDYKYLRKRSDEELISYLTTIKGVGRWTVEMILMFNLQRPDVFPIDDLGIVNGMKKLYNIRATEKKSLQKKLKKISDSWRPFRTLACMYVWKYKDS